MDRQGQQVRELDPAAAHARQRAGALLVDVRAAHERALGMADGALGAAREALEAEPEAFLPPPAAGAEILLICQGGRRSMLAAQALQARGYRNVASVVGGTTAWAGAGLPMTRADADEDFLDRYSRHLRLPEVGLEGQQRLAKATMLLLGAGGLGSPAALYLAAAGVGTLRIADDDVVERSNLQRQVLHGEERIGMPKVASAAATLAALNPRVRVEAIAERVDSGNVERLLEGVDVVVDGADNFPVRYLLNDACVKLGKPLVYGAVHRFAGQVSVFDARRARGVRPCYRCLFPEPPAAADAPSCSEAGVLGVLPGIIGLLQAAEAIKLVLGIGEPLAGRLLHFDALGMRFRETRLAPDPDCPVCAPGTPFPGYIDYARFCSG
jgi:molybdopterin/thiamine biosynthesis adenylyltransferase/rhodanese-related sulfurtransferase